MTELDVLTILKDNNGRFSFVELLNHGLSDAVSDPSADKALIRRMIKDGTLRGETSAYSTIYLTDAAYLRLRELEEQEHKAQESAKEKAEKEKQQRFENKLAVLNTITPIVTFIIGLLIGSTDQIAGLFSRLWHWILSLF